jgi:hypothetical protein
MALGKRLINTGAAAAACLTETTDIFGDSSGVALYSLDYDASDESGTYDGTPTDVDFGVDGQINYGARFNGSSSKITTSAIAGLSSVSVSIWLKSSNSTSTERRGIIEINSGTAQGIAGTLMVLYKFSNGEILVRSGNASSSETNILTHTDTSLRDGNWHNLIVTRNESTGVTTLYIDGSQVDQETVSNTSTVGQASIIGDRYTTSSGNFNWDGDIDQVRIFSEALDSTQVTQLYNETACVYTCTTDTVDYPTTNVAYYKLDNSAEDETGSYDGTESNIEYRFGRFGQAGLFNGTNSYIYASNSVQQPTTNFSVSVWVLFHQIKSSSVGVIGNFKTGVTPQIGWAIAHQNGTPLQFWADGTANSNGGMVQSTSSIPTNEWIHVVGTYDGSNVKIYINGDLENTKSYTQTPATTDQPLVIGRWYGNFDDLYTDGQIDQARIFSSALTDSQVTELYEEKPCEDTSNFKTVLYEGTSANQYISQVGFDLDVDNGGDGGFVWIKGRSLASNHALFDTVRGAQKRLESDTTTAENSNYTQFSSFDANGFTLGNQAAVNSSGDDYVSWVWKGGGDAVSNTYGSITSQVSANTDAGFSIVKWTGDATSNPTVGHGLNQEPDLYIVKELDNGTVSWLVGGNSTLFPETATTASFLRINTTDDIDQTGIDTFGNSGQNLIKVGARTNNGEDSIAYCFHSVSGYSKIGSYAGNSSTNKITLDFAPSWVMIKLYDVAGGNWFIYDNKRNPTNSADLQLEADTNAIDTDHGTGYELDFLSDGFELQGAGGAVNFSGRNYLYMAFK